jgi:RsiW-degrading membrane proteinase PrsW (M82 family)
MQETEITMEGDEPNEGIPPQSRETKDVGRASFWRSALWSLGGLALFVLLVGLIPQPRLEGGLLLIVGIVLALVPAALWLLLFYQQDRKEPEPKRIVLRVFLFGALMASGAGQPIIQDLFRVDEWLHGGVWLRLAGLILVVGFTQEFFKYAAVRYTVFPTADFAGRVDGIIYGVAAGLGYATALNLAYVISHEGVVPFVGSLQMVNTALIGAGFAAVTGYFLAGAKYGGRPVWWVPAGLATAAVLNGLVAFLRRGVAVQGLTYRPLNALFLSVGLVAVTLGVLYFMIRRAEWRARSEDIREEADGHAG